MAERKRRYRETDRDKQIELNQGWYYKNRTKYLCRARLQRAIKNGEIIKPTLCQKCGSAKPLQAHHKDYSKPLDVQWFCINCHGSTWRKTA
jgi:ribosomal protein S27AE